MSDSDSFINEVTEEVRREQLYGYLRRYGWIAVALVLLLVGGAAFNEYRNAQQRSTAQTTGDALLAALEANDASERAAAMADLPAEGAAVAVTDLLRAATLEEAGDVAAAAEVLGGLVINQDVPETYRDIAAFKLATLPTQDVAARAASLDALSQPGQPFRLLALEQRAYLALEAGETDAALTILRQIEEDAGVTRGLRERVQSLMLALGEPLPEPETE
ncbi:MAG: tetratricopeptide repeat protein [Pseudomonadota bacterium]